LAEAYPDTNAGLEVVVKPYAEEYVDEGARTSIITMLGAVVLVLLIACANVANLLIARNYGRLREFSIRAALGAGRARIVLIIMSECVMISLIGGAAAMWLAQWAGERTMEIVRTVDNFAPPYWVVIEPDWRTWSFALLAVLTTAVIAGLSPALKASRMDLNTSLREGGISVAGNPQGRLTRTLVTAQITLSCVVLIGGGLMARSVISLANLDVGASIASVMTGRIGLFPATYPETSDRLRFLEQLHERLESIPQVEAATISTSLPGTTTGWGEIHIEGITEGDQRHFAQVISIAPNYFDMFDIGVLEGRPFWRNDRAESQPVVVVNRHLVNQYWPGEQVIGQSLRIGPEGSIGSALTIVGVVSNVIQGDVNEPVRPAVYRPLAQSPPQFVSMAVRSNRNPAEFAEPMRLAVTELDRDLPVYWVRTLEDWIDLGRFRTNFLATLFGLFAVMGLLLGGVGQYGLLAYTVSLRAREIGVRRALGAMDKAVIGLLMRQSVGQLIIGLGIGLTISLGTARLLAFILYGVEPFDPLTFGLVAVVLIGTTLLAALLPARRALSVDPIVVLRYE
jgi:predicted permease